MTVYSRQQQQCEQKLAMTIARDKQKNCCKMVKVRLPCGCLMLTSEAKG